MDDATVPPAQAVWGLINAHAVARCMHVVAEAGVADALDHAPVPMATLATRTGVDADALHRMLRLLAAHGVFAKGDGGYAHTPASELLRSDHPQSLRAFARMIGLPAIWGGFTELRHAATTGRPARDWNMLLAHFAEHPDEARLFHQAMVDKSKATIPAVVEACDCTRFRRPWRPPAIRLRARRDARAGCRRTRARCGARRTAPAAPSAR